MRVPRALVDPVLDWTALPPLVQNNVLAFHFHDVSADCNQLLADGVVQHPVMVITARTYAAATTFVNYCHDFRQSFVLSQQPATRPPVPPTRLSGDTFLDDLLSSSANNRALVSPPTLFLPPS